MDEFGVVIFLASSVSILPLHHRIKDLLNGKVLPRCGRKKAPGDSITFSFSPFLSLSLSCFVFALLVCFAFVF